MTTSAESPRSMRIPNFFIVGQPKSGTTALYEALRRHPQIYMPDLKEPMFLASDLLAGIRWEAVRARPKTREDYLALFAPATAEQCVGEASSLYLSSRSAPVNIAELEPDARLVAVLREPVSLLRSLHLQLLQDHSEDERDLGRALALEDERRNGRRIPRECQRPASLHYSEHLHYVEQLRRYHALFASEQLLVLIYDDFRADNEATVRTVLQFLGVDHTRAVEVAHANPTVRLRSRYLDDVVQAITAGRGPVMRAVKAPVSRLTSQRMRRGAVRAVRRRLLYGDSSVPDGGLTVELRRRFKPEILALSEYLGRDLVSLWDYDGLD